MPGRIGRIAVRSVLAALVATLLPSCSTDPAALDTRIVAALDAEIVHRDGSTEPADVGVDLRDGDLVRTGDLGSVTLETGGRRMLTGGDARVRVTSGVRAALVRGEAVVDVRRGAPVSLTVGEVTVRAPRASVIRIDNRLGIRVGVYEGSARVTSRTRRGLTVSALHQAQTAGRALPAAARPLALVREDTLDRSAAPALVAADAALRALAGGIDSDPVVATVLPALDRSLPSIADAFARPSERVLAVAIARASSLGRSAAAVHSDRSDGGSWGVVAALAGAETTAVGGELDRLLTVAGAGPDGVVAVPAGDTTGGDPDGVAGGPATAEEPRPGATGTSRPQPSPTSSPTPEPDPIQEAVETVISALPVPLPPLPTPLAVLPGAEPAGTDVAGVGVALSR